MMRKLFQTQCPGLLPVVFLSLCLACTSCSDHSYGSPKGYDIKKPESRELGKSVNEISGLTYSPEDTSLLAVSDSKRKIFQIDLRREKLRDYSEKIYTQSDFEDLVKVDTTVFVLISDGTILGMPPHVIDSSNTVVYPSPFHGKNDFETMYYDPEAKGLIVICKECEEEKGQHRRTAYRFDLTTKSFDTAPFYSISTQDVRALVKNDDAELRPSAAAIHPIEKTLYILSSAGQILVITDTRGKVLEVFNLNPDLYPQAEGIAFSPNGTMYISNEGKFGSPNLLVFHYNKNKDTTKKK
jgi:uncharacterized protein YjiK